MKNWWFGMYAMIKAVDSFRVGLYIRPLRGPAASAIFHELSVLFENPYYVKSPINRHHTMSLFWKQAPSRLVDLTWLTLPLTS